METVLDGVNHIAIVTRDMDRFIHFYREAFDATVVHDDESNGDGRSRPSLRWALEQIAKGQANLLVVARLRDLSTNVANLPPLLRWFTEPERSLVALDLDLDTDSGRVTVSSSGACATTKPHGSAMSERP